jgi:HEAT repeat protein
MAVMRLLSGGLRWRRRKIWAIASLVFFVVVFAVVFSASRPRAKSGIVVRDRALEDWIEEFLRSNDYVATEAIKVAGSNAVPLLREPLKRRSTVANTLWVKTWPNLPPFLQNRFQKPVLARDARMNTVALLRDMPDQSKTILPDLLARLQDEDAQIRLHTAITLGNIGPDASAAVPMLLEFTRSTAHVTRVYSANALWKVSGEVEPALSVLEAGLKEKGAKFRWVTPFYLGEMGTNALRAVPLLVEASNDSDKEVASLALQALAQISVESVPVLVKHLESNDPAMRISAATALGKLGPKAIEAVPELRKLLGDSATGEPSIMGRAMGREKVSDAARSALERIQSE